MSDDAREIRYLPPHDYADRLATSVKRAKAMIDARDHRILIVEDEYLVADDLARGLTILGVDVVGPVGTLAEALTLIGEAQAIHGAVLDINLHGTMSYPVAAALIAANIPFLFVTGYDDWTIDAAYRHIARREKPVRPDDVITALFGPG